MARMKVVSLATSIFILSAAQVWAQLLPVPRLNVSSSAGIFSDQVNFSLGTNPDKFTVDVLANMGGALEARTNTGDLLGIFEDLQFSYNREPFVEVIFTFRSVTDATVSLDTGILNIPAINNAIGQAEAQITFESNDGGILSGLFPGPKAYQARYNETSLVTGDVFTNLVDDLSVVGSGSVTNAENEPRTAIPGVVTSLIGEFNFDITAGETATGEALFTVIPEPASLALLALGGIVFIGRRRG